MLGGLLSPPVDRSGHRRRTGPHWPGSSLHWSTGGARGPGREALAERGHYAFTQSLIRSVAYDTLSGPERKARHLRAATTCATRSQRWRRGVGGDRRSPERRLPGGWGGPRTPRRCGRRPGDAFVIAGDRAESIGAPAAAETAYLKARSSAADEAEQAGLFEKAGDMAWLVGASLRALRHYEAASAAPMPRGVLSIRHGSKRNRRHLLNLGRVEESVTPAAGSARLARPRDLTAGCGSQP